MTYIILALLLVLYCAVAVNRPQKCGMCGGKGRLVYKIEWQDGVPVYGYHECGKCEGRGKV